MCTRIYLIPISPPDLRRQKRNRLESQNHSTPPPCPTVAQIIHMSCFFPRKPENKSARSRSLQIFPSARRSLQTSQTPSCSFLYKRYASARLLPIRLHGIQSTLQLTQRPCLLLPTRFFPGRPKTPARASFLAPGASYIDSRLVSAAFHVVMCYIATASC